jgi:hypothetical protein
MKLRIDTTAMRAFRLGRGHLQHLRRVTRRRKVEPHLWKRARYHVMLHIGGSAIYFYNKEHPGYLVRRAYSRFYVDDKVTMPANTGCRCDSIHNTLSFDNFDMQFVETDTLNRDTVFRNFRIISNNECKMIG